jgi:hypothetical protein
MDLHGSRGRIHPMKRLALVLAAVAVVALPTAAEGAACSPLTCAASQFSLANGSLLGYRTAPHSPVNVVDLATGEAKWVLPWGVTNANLLVHQEGRTFGWWDASTDAHLYRVRVPAGYVLAGVSQNGTYAVGHRVRDGNTSFLIVSRTSQRTVTVKGVQWDFDALRGDNLFLIRYLHGGGYQVRLVHPSSGKLESRLLKDPHESGTIWGSPFSRLSSANGRYLFTLYIGQNGGAMIHELDTGSAKARCIDLPGTGDYGSATSWALTLSKDQRTLWAVNPGYGRVVAIDVVSRKVRTAFRIRLLGWNLGGGTSAALSPDGQRIAVADGQTVAIVDLARRKVAKRDPGKALALGFSPTGQLWMLS